MAATTRRRTRAADLAAEDQASNPERDAPEAAEAASDDAAEEGDDDPEETPPPPPPTRRTPPPAPPDEPAALRIRGRDQDDRAGQYTQPGAIPQGVPVCLRAWSGVVDGLHRIVRRGVPASKLPQSVIDMMLAKRGQFGLIKVEPPPPPRGTVVAKNQGRGTIRIG